MRVGLLGELEVLGDDGHEVAITGAKLRALVAVLALRAGRAVPTDELVDALWGEDPPPAVRNGLQGLVSKLRKALGSSDVVSMSGGGYTLEIPPEAVDVHRYERVVADARSALSGGDATRAIELLGEADSMWRGKALAEFTYDDFAAAPTTRLTELRLAATEERLDAELQLGRHHQVVGELEVLVAEQPLRERTRGLLMTALYRAGRQADALRVFQEGRHVLAEELGLEPGPELRQLEAAILAQDPSLEGPGLSLVATVPIRASVGSAIPAATSPLVGREHELRELELLLAEHRLVTLVGPGGVGKTRLSLEVARTRAEGLEHGGFLVELAPVGDPSGVRAAIAQALELPDPGRLAEMIGERELLVLLDNCEHVITSAAEVAEDLLRRCPRLRLVATSREGLRIGGETIWPVPPLEPDAASELFLARAHAAGARLEHSAELLAAVAEICGRLDGLPLAIELAAARARAFPVQQLAARLNDRFRLLTGGSRTALPRQQTLRAVVDWSYELLFDDEQRVFERLSVFPGGCDLAMAREVIADDTIPEDDLEELINALVDKSLVVTVPNEDVLRVRQLQILAQYGREKLAERGDAKTVRDAMATHVARLCAQSADAYIGPQQRTWLAAIDREHDNLRAALEWAVANDDAETALTIAGGSAWPHWLRAEIAEGRRWLDDAFACAGTATEHTRALALTGRGLLEFLDGRTDRSDADLEEALAVFRAEGDVAAQSLASSFYAEFAVVRGDVEEARRRRTEVLGVYRDHDDVDFATAAEAWSRGKLAVIDGDLTAAEEHFREAKDGFASIDRPVMYSISLGMVADFDELAGDFAAARETLDAAITTNDSIGLRGLTGTLVARLGWALLHQGELARAEAVYPRALDDARRLDNVPVLIPALTGMAVVHRLAGRDVEAADAASEAVQLYLAGGPRRFRNRIDPRRDVLESLAASCAVLAGVAADAGAGERAARLLGHVTRLLDDAASTLPPLLDADRVRARTAADGLLGSEAFAALHGAARRAELDESVISPG